MVCGWRFNRALDALNALQMQLEYTDRRYPDIPWVAVIRKTNKFTLSLNQRFQFEIMNTKHRLFDAVVIAFLADLVFGF